MKRLYLLRHGKTEAAGRFIGSTDIGVSKACYEQLDHTRQHLSGLIFGRVLCSPKRRCLQTAEYLQVAAGVNIEENLREIDFGLWENRSFTEIAAGWPEEVKAWSDWSTNFSFPGGESIGSFLERIESVAEQIRCVDEDQILLVSHGGVIRHLICALLGLPAKNYLLFDVQAGCLSTIELYSEGGVLTSLNQGQIR